MFRAIFILALPLLAVATPFAARQAPLGCPGAAPVQCCETLHSPTSHQGKDLLHQHSAEDHPAAFVGMVAAGCNTFLGILDSSTCGTTPVCCQAQPGAINIGCISLPL
ncbi:hypothetical protein BDW22DRAFT_1349294 [Trametopsis cervina]|nr:hypothetical protein BDW22DRAFT_1349294 [Trametopsis cervina]